MQKVIMDYKIGYVWYLLFDMLTFKIYWMYDSFGK